MDSFQRMPRKGGSAENGTSATRVVLYIVLASAISALATVGLCVGVLYGAYGALLSPTGAAKLSAIVSNMNVTDGAITGLLIGDMDTPHNLLLGAGTDETNFTGAWIKFGTEEYPGLLFEDAGNATSLLPVMHITSHMTTNKEHMLPDSLDGDSSIGRTLESGNCANPHLHAGGFIPPVFRRSVYSNSPFRRTINITIFPNGQRQLGPSRPTVR